MLHQHPTAYQQTPFKVTESIHGSLALFAGNPINMFRLIINLDSFRGRLFTKTIKKTHMNKSRSEESREVCIPSVGLLAAGGLQQSD